MHAHLRVNGEEGGVVQPQQPAEIALDFTDPVTGEPVKDFDVVHEKPMHLIVVSEDLSTFAHLHPELDADTGRFHMAINQPGADPDNRDAATAVPKAGRFLVFTEATPTGRGAQDARFTITAAGAPEPIDPPLDPTTPGGTIRKFFKADGSPGQYGDPYQALLSVYKMPTMTHLVLNLKQARTGADGAIRYRDVTDLEPWLGMPGHGVLISKSGADVKDRVFRHLHAGHHAGAAPTVLRDEQSRGAGPTLTFMVHDDIPPAGDYRLWCQVKHHGQVLTLPYTIRLA